MMMQENSSAMNEQMVWYGGALRGSSREKFAHLSFPYQQFSPCWTSDADAETITSQFRARWQKKGCCGAKQTCQEVCESNTMPFSSSRPAGGVPSSVFCLVGKDLARIEKHFFFAGSRFDAHCRLILLEGASPASTRNWVGWGRGEILGERCWFWEKGANT
jgi:hypothetical protein